MSIRQQKGLQIAQRANIIRDGNLWLVPSQSGKGKYKVNLDSERPSCTCPDYDFRRDKCKHIFAVEITVERQKTTTTTTDASGNTTTTPTEIGKATRKPSPQRGPAI